MLAGEAAAAQRAVNTRRSYAGVYRQFCAHLAAVHGRTPVLEDLAAQAVRSYRDQLEREGRSPATVAHHLSALRQLADRLDVDPAIQRVHADRVAPREPRALERAEYERLLAMPDRRTVAGRRDLAVLYVLGEAGLQRSELCALSYDDVGPVRRHRDPRLRPAVAARPADHTEYVVHVRRRHRPGVHLAASHELRPAGPAVGGRGGAIVTKHAVRAQLPADRLTAHVLRHTFCTLLAERGVALEVIAELAGHADVRTTRATSAWPSAAAPTRSSWR